VCLLEAGAIRFLNRAGALMLGLDLDERGHGRSFLDFIEPDYRLLAEEGWDILAAEEVVPLKLGRADGSWFEAELRVRRVPESEAVLIEARDISRFVRSAEALREREQRLQAILSSVAEGIVTIDEHGRIEAANPAVGRMFGESNAAVAGRALDALIDAPALGLRAGPGFVAAAHAAAGRTVEAIGRRPDGETFPLEMTLSTLRSGRGRSFTAILRDISERKENEERISRLAHHDSLTGLPNRNMLNDRLGHALARVRRHGGHVAVLYIDLDRFKPVNDTLGHEAGDAVLRVVAERFVSCIRDSDTVARIGGDEFVVVVEEINHPREAAMVARKILDVLAPPIDHAGHAFSIGASIGIAVFPEDGHDIETVCKAADQAMYTIKREGRNGYRFHRPPAPSAESGSAS